ncbi:hypothetical protein GH714_006326 [Hevea brasiliensis]|uniref:PGG domain-containing protein n=1 Tax=Hevea brasiliensis TaxID=3981 RepID=A0A6A6MDL0_HEVBR|nr:hypothetical protein GH714_006326 [Hevea brasiliensis]
MSGDWEMAMHNQPITARINKRGETALHIATAANHTHFVEKLVEMIAPNNMEHLAIKTVQAQLHSVYKRTHPSRTQAAVTVNLGRRAEHRIQAAAVAPQPQEPASQPQEQRNTTPAAIAPQAVGAAPTAGQIVEDPTMGRAQAAAALAFAAANAIAAQQENAQVTTVVTILAPAAAPQPEDTAPQPVDTASQSVEQGNTAFCYAAISGNVKIAKIMKDMKNDLPRIRGRQNCLPIYLAALAGHEQMVRELYEDYHSNNEVTDDDRISLLIALVESDIYDIALKMIQGHLELATMKDKDGKRSALHAVEEEKRKQGLELVEKLWEEVILDDEDKVSQFMIVPSGRLIFIAAENGNVEFLTILIRKYPHLVFKVDDDQCTIFHKAILNRHEKIFMLIFELGMMNLINIYEDKDGNNMLHLAGKMPQEESRVNVVPGAALQLQRELQWFEVVKKVVRPGQIAAKNVDGKTPRDVFLKEHKELREAAEKWMINTANSCMLVATLIATVVFAAAFTVPGGNGQDTGIPIFVRDTLFKIFAIADGLSLAFSTSSILSFYPFLLLDSQWMIFSSRCQKS